MSCRLKLGLLDYNTVYVYTYIYIYIYDHIIYVHIKAVVSSNIFCLFFFTICIGLLHLTRPDDSALEATNGAESIRSGVLNALYP